jgi:hypothetical protein
MYAAQPKYLRIVRNSKINMVITNQFFPFRFFVLSVSAIHSSGRQTAWRIGSIVLLEGMQNKRVHSTKIRLYPLESMQSEIDRTT